MVQKINLYAAFEAIEDYWRPHIAGVVNGQDVRLAKIKGAFDWHRHHGVEEAFLVVKGSFVMEFRDENVVLNEGDFLVVPAGEEHRPSAEEECWIVLIETQGTINTGDRNTDRTCHSMPKL